MSRVSPNPALQVAFVLFAMLAIMLGVSTFLLARRCQDLGLQAAAAKEVAQRSQALANDAQDANRELKGILGFSGDESLATVRQQTTKDMEAFAAALPESCRSYRAAVASLRDVVRDHGAQLSRRTGEVETIGARLGTVQATSGAQVREFEKLAQQSAKAVQDEQQRAAQQRERMTEDAQRLQRQMEQVREQTRTDLAAMEKKLDEARKQCAKLAAENERLHGKMKEYQQQEFAAAHGQVQRVNQRLGVAWINLGLADALPESLLFNVYPAASSSLTPSAQPGAIRVKRVVEDHLAETKSLEQRPDAPLMPGDKVHSPGWRKGP